MQQIPAEAGVAPEGDAAPLFECPQEVPLRPEGKLPIAVIGAGFSGTIATLNLLRRLPPDQPVLLCERAQEFARGLAYAAGNGEHLLNVRASNMSARADEPNHFTNWLTRRGEQIRGELHETPAGIFATRNLYGQYLRSQLDDCLRQTAARAQLRLLPDSVHDIAQTAGGYALSCGSGTVVEAAGVVLAAGNLPPEENAHHLICANPWEAKAQHAMQGELPLLIVGTGLTMVDLVLSLRRRGLTAPIIAISRAGLLPTGHAPTSPWPTPNLTCGEEASLTQLTARLRAEVAAAAEQGQDWRAVIDSLRPVTSRLWNRLPPAERDRFLRHARRFWDVHRHRMAPPHAAIIDDMRATGALRVVAGRIRAINPDDNGVTVEYAPRGGGAPTTLRVQRVIMASGVEPISRTGDTLIRRLIEQGLIRIDAHGLGIDVTPDLATVARDGTPNERIWALGPIVRGAFWECTAVPDIRVQASHLAISVVAQLRQDAPRWSFVI
jgi:uncharacterized NAD(P)/FAD-binding protein YdhS